MSRESRQSQPPGIDAAHMIRRKRTEAELLALDSQARAFGAIREQLSAAGKDASAFYRQLQARRSGLRAEVKAPSVGSKPLSVRGLQSPVLDFRESLLTRPIAPARFDAELGVFGFGSFGHVQVPAAVDGVDVVAQGKYPSSGEIVDVPSGFPGFVQFEGDLFVGPDEIPPSQYDPTIDYFWLRTWKYLIPFPPTTMRSALTYTFDVGASFSLFGGGLGQVMSFVSLGETPDLMQGGDVTVDIDGGWPINHDLSQPGPAYNGTYGQIIGQATVQRTFEVIAGKVPGVAIVVGAVVGLPMQSEVNLFFGGTGSSGITVGSQNQTGRVTYSYAPQFVSEPLA
jgi:hypothetical protein